MAEQTQNKPRRKRYCNRCGTCGKPIPKYRGTSHFCSDACGCRQADCLFDSACGQCKVCGQYNVFEADNCGECEEPEDEELEDEEGDNE